MRHGQLHPDGTGLAPDVRACGPRPRASVIIFLVLYCLAGPGLSIFSMESPRIK
jgi:hypothetical protein